MEIPKKHEIHVGFSGTQDGTTPEQYETLEEILFFFRAATPKSTLIHFHHGDCIGSDKEAHTIAAVNKYITHSHPPLNESKRAFCATHINHEPKDYLERNEDIAEVCDFLISTPKTEKEIQRSGTWATIRYVDKLGKEAFIILPNGQLTSFNEL